MHDPFLLSMRRAVAEGPLANTELGGRSPVVLLVEYSPGSAPEACFTEDLRVLSAQEATIWV